MSDGIAKRACPWHVAPFCSYGLAEVLKTLAGLLIGLAAYGKWKDAHAPLVILLVCLITVPMQLGRGSPLKVELQQENQIRRTLALLQETPSLRRDGDKLR